MGYGRYVLDENDNPVEEPDLLKWGNWFQTNNRIVKHDHWGRTLVSTVFLGLDHSFGNPHELPTLWETMIFRGPADGYQRRYTSRSDALAGHARAVRIAHIASFYGPFWRFVRHWYER